VRRRLPRTGEGRRKAVGATRLLLVVLLPILPDSLGVLAQLDVGRALTTAVSRLSLIGMIRSMQSERGEA
jgi:hypothetical protein